MEYTQDLLDKWNENAEKAKRKETATSALDEIVKAYDDINCHSDAENFHLTVGEILEKHKLV